MNILTAMKTALAAFPQRERREALVQFVCKYANPMTRLTHYRCVGLDSDVIVTFLKSLGFGDEDFTVVESALDPDTRQIRWTQGSTKHIQLASRLQATAANTNPVETYRRIMDGNIQHVFFDEQNPETQPHDKPFWRHIQGITDEIITSGYSSLLDATIPSDTAPESRQKIHMLPISHIEHYARMNGLLNGLPDIPEDPVFSVEHAQDTPVSFDTAVRYMRETDSLHFTAGIYDAPTPDMLRPYPSPLDGFLVNTQGGAEANGAAIPEAKHLYVLTTGRIHPTVTTTEFATDAKKFWTYVATLYEKVYKVKCAIAPGSRIGVVNTSTTDPIKDLPVYPGVIPHWLSPTSDGNLVMIGGVILIPVTGSEDSLKSRLLESIHPGLAIPPSTFIVPAQVDRIEHLEHLPDDDDLPAMWFATIRRLADWGKNIFEFREKATAWRAKSADLSQFPSSNATDAYPPEIPDRYSHLSMGITAAMLEYCPSSVFDSMQVWGGSPGPGHKPYLYVTNVYTGIVTDSSPTPGIPDSIFRDGFADTWTLDYLTRDSSQLDDRTAAFTEFIIKMNSNTDTAQWTVTPHPGGHPRFFDMIIETNYDFTEFKHWYNVYSPLDRERLRNAILAYMFHVIGSHINTDGPFDSGITTDICYPKHDEMLREIASQTEAELSTVLTESGLSCHQVNPKDYSSLTARPDAFGRTYFIIRFHEDAAQHMMASARFSRGLPPHTQSMARAILSARGDHGVTDRELQHPTSSTVRKYIGLVYGRKKLDASMSNAALRLPSDRHVTVIDKLNVWTHAYAERYISMMGSTSRIGTRSYDKHTFMNPHGAFNVSEGMLMPFTRPISSWFVR